MSYYLFVDSLKPIELLVCFSALVRWGESGALTKDSPPIEPGLLTAETVSWKSLRPHDLVVKIHTYATKAAVVRLPVGRHMLLFTASSPVGHSIHICSMGTFVVGDEDVVLPSFEPESYRFTEQSLTILKAVGHVIANFKDKGRLSAALKDLQTAHYPIPLQDKELTAQHFRKGYTFVAEAYTGDMYMPSSRWKLRLIGSYHPLPFLCRDPPCNTFAIKEIRDYYIPNDKKIVFRYSLKVALPHPVTIQVRMSKPDAFIKLQILENEEVIVSATGKGQAIIPAINCLGGEKALSSQSSKQILLSHAAPKKEQEFYIKKKSAQGSQKYYKRLGSAIDTGQPIVDEETTCVPTTEENTSTSQQVYKYVIQCSVLYNSWPLTESQLMFVQALKDLEKNDSKAHGEKHEELITLGSPDSHTISEGQKSSGTSRITRKGKEKSSEKEKTAKEKQAPRFEPQAAQARLHYLSRFIKKMPDAESVPMSESQTKAGEVETSSSVIRESDTKSPMSLDSKETIPSGSTLWKKWQLSKSLKDLAKPTSSDSGGSSPSSFPKEEREQGMRKENISKYCSY
ncbi:hypothetical protein CB1_000812006 [Camelus ferus]|nr:hypothetical protein CB1_000812006 [Camelus ferus]